TSTAVSSSGVTIQCVCTSQSPMSYLRAKVEVEAGPAAGSHDDRAGVPVLARGTPLKWSAWQRRLRELHKMNESWAALSSADSLPCSSPAIASTVSGGRSPSTVICSEYIV